MNFAALVQIIAAPVACADGIKDAWRETVQWAARQLTARFGEALKVEYIDLFDPDCPSLPQGAQLPLVLVNGQVVSSGGKISVPVIRRYLESLGMPAIIPDRNPADSPESSDPGKIQCSCSSDQFASLPPELRPRPKNSMGDLRKVTCPNCSKVYWTNRTTDLCLDCEKKDRQNPSAGVSTEKDASNG